MAGLAEQEQEVSEVQAAEAASGRQQAQAVWAMPAAREASVPREAQAA